MRKAFVFDSLQGRFFAGSGNLPAGQSISAPNDLSASNFDQPDGLGLAWFKADSRACRNIEALSIGLSAVESESGIGFYEMIMAADLNRTVTEISDG